MQTHPNPVQTPAQIAYAAYCAQAGGVTFDNKPLPTFAELGENRQACWQAAATEATSHPAAQAVAAFNAAGGHDGHADWYLPSIGELRLAYLHCAELFQTDEWYWSSTQYGRYGAWIQGFAYGSSDYNLKDTDYRVRPARRLFI